MSFLAQGRSTGDVDVSALLDASTSEYVAGIVKLGVLVSIGTTSDGGSLMLQLTFDGEWRREYFRDAEDLHEYLKEAEQALTSELSRPSTAQRPRKRRSKPV